MKKFNVDKNKKKKLHKQYIRSKPLLYLAGNLLLAVMVLFTAVFCIYSLTSDTAFLVRDMMEDDYGQKNKLLIGFVVVTVDIVLVFLWVVFKLVIKRVTGKNISERVNETLIWKDSILEYGYQNFAGATRWDRIIVRIPVDRMEKITYQSKLGRLQFTGPVSMVYYDDYEKKLTDIKEKYENQTVVLFDYFNPSLYIFLTELGVRTGAEDGNHE